MNNLLNIQLDMLIIYLHYIQNNLGTHTDCKKILTNKKLKWNKLRKVNIKQISFMKY